MLRPRIIPCLLIHQKGLVKTVKFQEGKYVGDPLNAVKIFNEKAVDELMVVDIDATVEGREPDYQLIKNLALECRMPLCYGGGVKTVEQARKILALGVEKIAISSALLDRPELANEIAEQLGQQSVVAVLDLKKKRFGHKHEIYTHNAKQKNAADLEAFVKRLGRDIKVGEVVFNFIDQDGVMQGYNLELANKLRALTTIPMTVLGGAGSLADISKLIAQHPIIGAAAGSLFVFKGKYKAVLISYPSKEEKEQLGV